MSEGIPYADIVILALVAVFVLLRLRSVLGQNSDAAEGQDFFKKNFRSVNVNPEPIVQVDERALKPKPKDEPDTYLTTLGESALADTLKAIREKDPFFRATDFLNGAKLAFEMVFDAFAKGDRQTLKQLLADLIYKHFASEIDEREKAQKRTETTLVAVTSKDITDATLIGNMARITTKFKSEQVTVVRDAEGKIIEGNPSDLHEVEDEWTFERDLSSKNPNWKIIET